MIGHHPPGGMFGGRHVDATPGCVRRAGDPGTGQVHFRQPVEQQRVVGQRRHQEHAVRAQRRDQPVQHFDPLLAAVGNRLHHQMIAKVAAARRCARLDAAGIGGGGVAVEIGDHEGAATGQPPRRLVGAIAQLLDRRVHPLAQFVADVRRLVDNAGHRLDRDFGEGGDVMDAGHDFPIGPGRRRLVLPRISVALFPIGPRMEDEQRH